MDVPTIAEVITRAVSLRPRDAMRYTSADRAATCSTPVITAIRLDDGSIRPLRKIADRHAAGYARVSSKRQQQDGWSQEDQLTRIVQHFVELGLAFQIFSDAGLPGSLPYIAPEGGNQLAERLAEKRAKRYESAYCKVFLDNARYLRFRPQMEAHLAQTLSTIRTKAGIPVPLDSEEEAVVAPKLGRPSLTPSFRPGLTSLVEALPTLHTIAVTDLSRISRSQILFADLAERLNGTGVKVTGLMEDLAWISGSGEIGADIVAYVLSRLAEHRLGELTVNILRGQVTKLEAGEPSGLLPSWLTRGDDGKAFLNDRVSVVQRIVSLALQGTPLIRIAHMLTEDRVPIFGHNGGGYKGPREREWYTDSIRVMLRNPALIGKQVLFGISWDVLPRIVSDADWDWIQARLDAASRSYPKATSRYLASHLFRCTCGHKLTHRATMEKFEQYICTTPPTTRRARPNWRHVALNRRDTDVFLSELMQYDPTVIINAWRDTRERSRLREEVERLEVRLNELQNRFPAEERRAREEARLKAKTLYEDEDEGIVSAITRRILTSVYQQREELETAIRTLQRRIASLLPSDQIADVEERARTWKGLDVNAQNELLLTLFKEWRVEGDPPNEYIVPVLNRAEETTLPPIILKSIANSRSVRRRFPTVEEWIESWVLPLPLAEEHSSRDLSD